jgi:hypothetical protein
MAQVVAAVMKNNAPTATMEGTIDQEVVNVPSGSDATNWHHRLSTLEGLMAQVIAAMMKNKAPTVSVEGTKNQEEVANVPHAPRMMKPYDLDKTFEASALPTVNRHESMISHRYPVGLLTKTFLRPIEYNVLPSKISCATSDLSWFFGGFHDLQTLHWHYLNVVCFTSSHWNCFNNAELNKPYEVILTSEINLHTTFPSHLPAEVYYSSDCS